MATSTDSKKLMASIAKGWKLVPTPKVRAGFKKGQQQIVQADGKTLGLLTLRDKGVRVEGSRLAKNLTVTDAKGVAEARKLLAAVEQENKAKSSTSTAKAATRATVVKAQARMSAQDGVKVVAPSGNRARSRAKRTEVLA